MGINIIKAAHRLLEKIGNHLQPAFLLAVRLYWGWQFFETGWGKLQNLGKVTQFFAQLGLPAPAFTAGMVGTIEFAGGILLVAGLASRFSSLVLFCSMTVAYFTAEREAFFSVISDPGKFYGADAYTFWFAALLILVLGPGKLSLDSIIVKQTSPAAQPRPALTGV